THAPRNGRARASVAGEWGKHQGARGTERNEKDPEKLTAIAIDFMSRNISFRDFDWLLVVFVLIICAVGVLEIRSATTHTKFAGAHIRQVYWIGAGLVGMLVVSMLNYQMLLERVHWMYIAALASLMSVLIFGQKYLGARRWVKLPGGNH